MVRNLNYVIENYCLKAGIVGSQHYQQLLQFEIDGYRKLQELGLVKSLVKAVSLPVVDNKANLPVDFVEMIRMGICRCGVMINFDKNDDLCLPHEQKCACTADAINNCFDNCTGNTGNNLDGWLFPVYGQPYSYSYTVGSYAIGPGNYHGGYKIDYHNSQIIFDSVVQCDSVVLEYIGDFMNDMGNALVPAQLIEPLVQWLDYETKYWSPDPMRRREAGAARTRWYQTVRDVNARNNAMNKHEWVQLFRAYMYLSVKA